MRKCPYCAELIQDEAVKCRYCDEFLQIERKQSAWYFKIHYLVIAFFMVGPFALPLVFMNPNISKRNKIIITAVVLIISGLLTVSTLKSLKYIKSYYDFIDQLG